MRNPIVEINGLRCLIIGDPHLGRSFENGTAPERRGEREAKQWYDFEWLLGAANGDIVVIIGDIFDKFKVSNETVMRAADLILACQKPIYVMRGNHDASKDKTLVSSFDILRGLCAKKDSIVFVSETVYSPEMHSILVGYDAFKTAADCVSEIPTDAGKFEAIFTHMDLDDFGGPNHNLMPYTALGQRTSIVYNGHVHKPETRTGVGGEHPTVHVVGSMQPYAHGEELPEDNLYTTVTVEEFEKDPTLYQFKCLRLLLEPGQKAPDNIQALNVVLKTKAKAEEAEKLEVNFDEFDFEAMFNSTLIEAGTDQPLVAHLWDKYQEKLNADAA